MSPPPPRRRDHGATSKRRGSTSPGSFPGRTCPPSTQRRPPLRQPDLQARLPRSCKARGSTSPSGWSEPPGDGLVPPRGLPRHPRGLRGRHGGLVARRGSGGGARRRRRQPAGRRQAGRPRPPAADGLRDLGAPPVRLCEGQKDPFTYSELRRHRLHQKIQAGAIARRGRRYGHGGHGHQSGDNGRIVGPLGRRSPAPASSASSRRQPPTASRPSEIKFNVDRLQHGLQPSQLHPGARRGHHQPAASKSEPRRFVLGRQLLPTMTAPMLLRDAPSTSWPAWSTRKRPEDRRRLRQRPPHPEPGRPAARRRRAAPTSAPGRSTRSRARSSRRSTEVPYRAQASTRSRPASSKLPAGRTLTDQGSPRSRRPRWRWPPDGQVVLIENFQGYHARADQLRLPREPRRQWPTSISGLPPSSASPPSAPRSSSSPAERPPDRHRRHERPRARAAASPRRSRRSRSRPASSPAPTGRPPCRSPPARPTTRAATSTGRSTASATSPAPSTTPSRSRPSTTRPGSSSGRTPRTS